MSICIACEGVGTVLLRGIRDECQDCDGKGRLCRFCRSPLELTERSEVCDICSNLECDSCGAHVDPRLDETVGGGRLCDACWAEERHTDARIDEARDDREA